VKKAGDVVIYLDAKGEPHNALLTSVHPLMPEHLSLVYVDDGMKEVIGVDHAATKDVGLNCWLDAPTYEQAAERGYHQGFYEGITHVPIFPKPADPIHVPIPAGTHKDPSLPGVLIKDGTEPEGEDAELDPAAETMPDTIQ